MLSKPYTWSQNTFPDCIHIDQIQGSPPIQTYTYALTTPERGFWR